MKNKGWVFKDDTTIILLLRVTPLLPHLFLGYPTSHYEATQQYCIWLGTPLLSYWSPTFSYAKSHSYCIYLAAPQSYLVMPHPLPSYSTSHPFLSKLILRMCLFTELSTVVFHHQHNNEFSLCFSAYTHANILYLQLCSTLLYSYLVWRWWLLLLQLLVLVEKDIGFENRMKECD